MTPRVGIVIPAFNVESFVADSLDSLIAQDFVDWECVVVDDGSTDATAQVVARYTEPRIRLVRQENAGVSAARNRGLAESAAPAVLFLDGDDLLHPSALRRLEESLRANPDAVLVFGTTMRVTPSGHVEPGQKDPRRHSFVTGDVLASMLTHDRVFWNGGQLLARTSALRRAGGYRSGLRLSEDWEFFTRLSALGPCVFIGPQEEILRHRVHPGSAAPTLSLDLSNHLPAIDAVFANAELRGRFSEREWRAMRRQVVADHEFETGRQNFAQRRFGPARRMMLKGTLRSPSRRRLALLVLAQVSQVVNRPLVGPLRFHEADTSR